MMAGSLFGSVENVYAPPTPDFTLCFRRLMTTGCRGSVASTISPLSSHSMTAPAAGVPSWSRNVPLMTITGTPIYSSPLRSLPYHRDPCARSGQRHCGRYAQHFEHHRSYPHLIAVDV